MIFTYLTRALALMAAIYGIAWLAAGFVAATGQLETKVLSGYELFSGARGLIEQGAIALVFAGLLGTLSDISYSVRKSADHR